VLAPEADKERSCAMLLRNWKLFLLLLVLTWLALPGICAGQQRSSTPEKNAFMDLKLKNAQMVLSGLATKDFESIQSGAENLVRLSQKAEFQLGALPGYDAYNVDFRKAASLIEQSAKKKNLAGATLGYLKLTNSCIDCHKLLRQRKEP
jgi:hypothetical protein